MRSATLTRWLPAAVLCCGGGSLAATAGAATTDLEAVRQAIGFDDSPSASALSGNHEHVIDLFAKLATARLGQGDPGWKPANPLWPGVYTRVRADLEPEGARLDADLTAASRQSLARLVSAVAAEVSQSDVEAVLAYYGTAEGQRYQALMHQLDLLLPGGLPLPPGGEAGKLSPPLPEDQQKALLRMMILSRLLQAASGAEEVGKARHADTSGLGGVAFMAMLAQRTRQSQLTALYAEYAPDLAAFAAFEQTPAAHDLFRALGGVMFLSKQPPVTSAIIEDVVKSAEQRHGREWQDYYRTATGR